MFVQKVKGPLRKKKNTLWAKLPRSRRGMGEGGGGGGGGGEKGGAQAPNSVHGPFLYSRQQWFWSQTNVL